LQIEWTTTGEIEARLYDGFDSTHLAAVTGPDTGIDAGGIAFLSTAASFDSVLVARGAAGDWGFQCGAGSVRRERRRDRGRSDRVRFPWGARRVDVATNRAALSAAAPGTAGPRSARWQRPVGPGASQDR
jgi:hypothetical protein